MGHFKKLWGDPVWSKVIATGILALMGAVSSYFLDWWPSIRSATIAAWDYALQETSVTNWILWPLILIAVLVGYVVARLIWEAITGPREPAWRQFTQDNFFGLTWGWNYFDDGRIKDLHSLCQRCLYQVFPKPTRGYAAVIRYEYHCDSCGKVAGPFDEERRETESKVTRLIQQKLRTGKWPSAESL